MDILATFRAPLERVEAEKVWRRKELRNVRPVTGELGSVRARGFHRDYLLYSAGNLRDILELEFTAGGMFSSDHAAEVIFSKVDHLPIRIGDRVEVTSDKITYTLKVVGILNRMTTGIAYLPPQIAEKMLEQKFRGFTRTPRCLRTRLRNSYIKTRTWPGFSRK